MPIDQVHSQDFAQCLHSVFSCQLAPGTAIPLELMEITYPNEEARRERFSLFLRGPSTPRLAQGIYNLAHEKLGELSLFLVPVDHKPDGMHYEITFNRQQPPPPAK